MEFSKQTKKDRVKRVSDRLRKTMVGELVFPDSRDGLTPYSLICSDCGNFSLFTYETTVRMIFSIDDDLLRYKIDDRGAQMNPNEKVAAVVERHLPHELIGNIEKYKRLVSCFRCSSDNIILYGDILSECYLNNCVGCFRCGGAYNEDHIAEHCKKCLTLRSDLAEDKALFLITLDMDMYCDACPIFPVRDGHGISGDEIKRSISGRLV